MNTEYIGGSETAELFIILVALCTLLYIVMAAAFRLFNYLDDKRVRKQVAERMRAELEEWDSMPIGNNGQDKALRQMKEGEK